MIKPEYTIDELVEMSIVKKEDYPKPGKRDFREQLVPASPDAEQAVLGSVLIDPAAIVEIQPILKAEDFYNERNAWIYQAMLDLHGRHDAVDLLTVSTELEKRKQLDEVGGDAYVMDLLNVVPTSSHAVHYARMVEEASVRRKLIRAASQIVQVAHEESESLAEVLSKSLAVMDSATRRNTLASSTKPFDDALARVYERAKEAARIAAEGGVVSIPYPLKALQELTKGIFYKDGPIVVIGALPKAGKTTLAINFAEHAAGQGFRGLIISLEMQDTQVVERVIASPTGYTALDIRSGNILDWDAFDGMRERLSIPNLWIDDSASLTIEEISTIVRRLHAQVGLHFFVIDYAQLVAASGRIENRTQEISKVIRGIKALAKDLGIAAIVIAQFNRDYTRREDKRPRSADLEGSSQIEKEASLIVLINRKDDPANELEAASATIIVDRSRDTPTGEFVVGYNGEESRFTDTPVPFTTDQREKWKAMIAKQCNALPLTWGNWQLRRQGTVDDLLAEARSALPAMQSDLKAVITPLLKSWKGAVDEEALAALIARTPDQWTNSMAMSKLIREIVSASQRLLVLRTVQYKVMPALQDKRLAVFFGPPSRGKTHMAKILQAQAIKEYGLPAVWLNWRLFMRELKDTFGPEGRGQQWQVWRQSRAPVLILDDVDKMIDTEFQVQYLYDVLEEALNLSGTPRSVVVVLNNTPKEINKLFAQHGHTGVAVAHRMLDRGNPVFVNFLSVPSWQTAEEKPLF